VRIVHVAHGCPPETHGGVESYVQELLGLQRAAGHDVALIAGSFVPWPAVGVEEATLVGARVLRIHRDDLYFDHFSKLWHPGVERLVRELYRELRPDLVHVHQWIRLTGNLVAIAAELGVPAVVTLHDMLATCPRCFRVRPGDVACGRPLAVGSCLPCVPRFGHESDAEIAAGIELFRDELQDELQLARAVLTATGAAAAMVGARTAFPRERLTVLPLGYRRRFTGRQPQAPPPGDLVLGYFGSVARHKGVHVLLQALRLAGSGVRLHVLGGFESPGYEQQLRELAGDLPVTFHGAYDFAKLAAVPWHAAVFPTLAFETHAFVLDECFELGLPCIVSEVGALPERSRGASLVVPPGDPVALASAIGTLRDDRSRLVALRRAIPGLPGSPEEHAQRLQQVYAAAIASPRGPFHPVVDPQRRIEFLLRQRESALGRVIPEGGPR
jgi:glycosyltransferase involved in cell wall biosynthesis